MPFSITLIYLFLLEIEDDKQTINNRPTSETNEDKEEIQSNMLHTEKKKHIEVNENIPNSTYSFNINIYKSVACIYCDFVWLLLHLFTQAVVGTHMQI